jgi:hypothetical protein
MFSTAISLPLASWLLTPPVLALDFEGLLKGLIQVALLVFFFGGPLLGRGKKAGDADPDQPAPRPRRASRSEAERKGEDLWKQLLEGLEPKEQKPPSAPPQRPTPRPAQARATTAAQPSGAPPRPPPIPGAAQRATGQTGAPPAVAASKPAARMAEPSAPEALGTELAPAELNDIQFSEIDEEAVERDPTLGVAPPIAATSGEPAVPGVGGARRVGWLDPGTDWRRAMILAEVLGPPVSLRGTQVAHPQAASPRQQ